MSYASQPAIYHQGNLSIPLFLSRMDKPRNIVISKGLSNPPFRTTSITIVVKRLGTKVTWAGSFNTREVTVLVPDAEFLYLENLARTRRTTTLSRAKQILKGFVGLFYDREIEDLTASELTSYIHSLKVGNRTKFNHQIRIEAMLRYHGINLKADKVRYVVPLPVVYTKQELGRLFSVCDIRQLTFYKTLQMTGLRMQEVKWLEWSDILGGMIHIRPKPPNFIPKTHEERRLPLPQQLQSLFNQMPHRPGTLVFPTAKGTPDRHLLRHLKRLARKAGMDESKWSLHGFRRTFATTCLRAGMDVRTVMMLMGHSDIESTLRYWKPVEVEQLRSRIGDIFQ